MARPASGWRYLWIAVFSLSAARFSYEVFLICRGCCYDFPIFWNRAHDWIAGGALYSDNPAEHVPGSGTYKYPPFVALTMLPLATLLDLRESLVLLLAVQVVCYAAFVWLASRALAPPEQRRFYLAALTLLALNHGSFFETLLRLQYENPLLLGLMLALALALAGKDFASGFVIAVCAWIKVYPAFLMAYFVARWRGRALFGFVAGNAALLLLCLAVFGARENRRYFLEVLPVLGRELSTDTYGTENAGVPRQLEIILGLEPESARRGGDLIGGGLLLISAAVAAFSPRRGRQALHFALFVPATLLGLPNSWTNYQLLLLLPIAALLAHRLQSGTGPTLGDGCAAISYVLIAYHGDSYIYPFSVLAHVPLLTETWLGCRPVCSLLVWVAVLWALLEPDGRATGADPFIPELSCGTTASKL